MRYFKSINWLCGDITELTRNCMTHILATPTCTNDMYYYKYIVEDVKIHLRSSPTLNLTKRGSKCRSIFY